jgi:dTDP-glucose 4,6-dehydratase
MAYHHAHGIPDKIIRILNSYATRMRRANGRRCPTSSSRRFMAKPLNVQSDGMQTRSLCYVDSSKVSGVI